jgi:hypothetical protein
MHDRRIAHENGWFYARRRDQGNWWLAFECNRRLEALKISTTSALIE